MYGVSHTQDTFKVTPSKGSTSFRPSTNVFGASERYVFLFQRLILITKKKDDGFHYRKHIEVWKVLWYLMWKPIFHLSFLHYFLASSFQCSLLLFYLLPLPFLLLLPPVFSTDEGCSVDWALEGPHSVPDQTYSNTQNLHVPSTECCHESGMDPAYQEPAGRESATTTREGTLVSVSSWIIHNYFLVWSFQSG